MCLFSSCVIPGKSIFKLKMQVFTEEIVVQDWCFLPGFWCCCGLPWRRVLSDMFLEFLKSFLWHTCFTRGMAHCSRQLKPAVMLISSRRPGFKSKIIFISDFYTMKMAASLDVENVANSWPNCWVIPFFSPQSCMKWCWSYLWVVDGVVLEKHSRNPRDIFWSEGNLWKLRAHGKCGC